MSDLLHTIERVAGPAAATRALAKRHAGLYGEIYWPSICVAQPYVADRDHTIASMLSAACERRIDDNERDAVILAMEAGVPLETLIEIVDTIRERVVLDINAEFLTEDACDSPTTKEGPLPEAAEPRL